MKAATEKGKERKNGKMVSASASYLGGHRFKSAASIITLMMEEARTSGCKLLPGYTQKTAIFILTAVRTSNSTLKYINF
jgi:hypothetical protein